MMRVSLDASQREAVMAGPVPASHALPLDTENVDARHKAGDDDAERVTS